MIFIFNCANLFFGCHVCFSIHLGRLLRFLPRKQESMDMQSVTLLLLIFSMGKNLKILFLHPTIVM